jgi:hypothetical protein
MGSGPLLQPFPHSHQITAALDTIADALQVDEHQAAQELAERLLGCLHLAMEDDLLTDTVLSFLTHVLTEPDSRICGQITDWASHFCQEDNANRHEEENRNAMNHSPSDEL